MKNSTIETANLVITPVEPRALRVLIDNDLSGAAELHGGVFVDSWAESQDVLAIRLADIEKDLDFLPWSLRIIMRKSDRLVVGHIGCHASPGADYSEFLKPMGVEFGYTVFPPYRRQGIALEAVNGLMAWALENGASHFILSIAPDNAPSLALAEKLGFSKVGSHIDEKDGPEDIFMWRPAQFGYLPNRGT